MEDKQIIRYAMLMEELNLTGLEMEADGVRLRLERMPAVQSQTVTAPAATAEGPAVPAEPAPAADVVEVRSPMVGVFYSAPTESAQPFVRRGSKVKKGDVLCIIEAMKLMNEITAECDGEIVDIGAGNNQTVDYGHVLFRIQKEKP